MILPEAKFIPEKQVPHRPQQQRIWLSLFEKTPKGQSAVLEFKTRDEAIKARARATSVLCQQKSKGKYANFVITINEKTLYIINNTS